MKSEVPGAKSETDYEAENDCRTMRECVKIMKDPKRKAKAMAAMEQMEKDQTEAKKMMEDMVKGH